MKKKICVFLTASLAIKTLYRGQVKYLVEQGYDVTLIAGKGKEHQIVIDEGGKSISISIKRQPSFFSDLRSFLVIWWHLIFNRYDLIIISTPKVSFLASIASFLSFNNNLLYVVRGRAYENYKGIKYSIFKFMDKATCFFSKKVQFISDDLMKIYIDEHICGEHKVVKVANGSSKGVDTNHYSPSSYSADLKNEVKLKLNIVKEDFIWVYCGRIRKDKGINELVKAFLYNKKTDDNQKLILVGPYEEWDPLEPEVLLSIKNNISIVSLGWVDDPAIYIAIADVFVFPSYREGFGNVAIEAASMGTPVIAFNVIGCRESVKNEVSGLLVNNIDWYELSCAVSSLYENREKLSQLKISAREWSIKNFDREFVLFENLRLYESML